MAAMPSTPRTARPAPAVTGPELEVGLGPLVVVPTVTVPNSLVGVNDEGGKLEPAEVEVSSTGQTVVVTMTSTVVMVLWLGQLVTVTGHWVMVLVMLVVMVLVVHSVVEVAGASVSVSDSVSDSHSEVVSSTSEVAVVVAGASVVLSASVVEVVAGASVVLAVAVAV